VTITATPPRRTREQLLTEAREHVGSGSIPSIETLRATLRVRRETAAEVRRTLSRERSERRAERVRQGRAAMAAVARRKRPRPRPAVVIAPVPELAPAPVAELTTPAPTEVTGIVRDEAADARPVAAETSPVAAHRVVVWPLLVIACSPFIAIWGGWVGLGKLTGFGFVNLLPGMVDEGGWATLDTAITLPLGMEAYSAYAFYVLLHPAVSRRQLLAGRRVRPRRRAGPHGPGRLVSPELIAAFIAAAGIAFGIAGGRLELSTLPPKPDPEPTEGADDAAEAVPAADL
jgi:hypothetical protein